MAETHEDRPFPWLPLRGRRPIRYDADGIDASNVSDALSKALPLHHANAAEISYLWHYYKGAQPILGREKQVRPEITNRIVENHAQEIVAFKIGYQLAEPMQYTARMQGEGDEGYDGLVESVNELNTLMFAEDKASQDRDLFEWMCVCGQGYRLCEADRGADAAEGGAPFELHTLDPRQAFVVRSSGYANEALMGVWCGKGADGKRFYDVWTDRMLFRVADDMSVVSERPHTYGAVPIIEYRLNNARMGVFEPVLPLLDAINALESNRMDDIEQTVQALIVFKDCEIDSEGFDAMRERGAVKIRSGEGGIQAAIQMLSSSLDHAGVQSVKEDLYQSVVSICGMPNRNGQGSSTSDTGAAVLLRDGWTLAESHAKSYELQFKRAERDLLRVALGICRQSASCDIDLRIRDVELAFNRRNYENIQVKSQVLTTMLACGKIHPQLAFEACGMFTDPDAAYMQSAEYAEEAAARPQPAQAAATEGASGAPGPDRMEGSA